MVEIQSSKDLKTATIVGGVKWTTFSMIVSSLVQILKIVVLTRFLSTEDYGLMAIILLVLGFTSLFSELGMGVALMHKQNVTQNDFSSLYWSFSLLSIVLYIILCLCTPLVAQYYAQPILNKLIPLMGLELVIVASGKLYGTLREKCFDFRFMSILTSIAVITSLIISVVLAITGFGVYSLIYSALLQSAILHIGSLITTFKKAPLLFHFSFQEVKPFLKIGLYQSGAGILDYFSGKFDILLIGRLFGMETLGIYSLAKDLIIRLFSLVNSVVNRVAFPTFAKMQDNRDTLIMWFGRLQSVLAYIIFPIYCFILLYSHSIVLILYDESFVGVANLLSLLTIYGAFASLMNFSSVITGALGRTDMSFIWTIIQFVIMPICVYLSSQFSIVILSITVSCLSVVNLILYWRLIFKKIVDVSLSKYIYPLTKPFIITIITGFVLSIVSYFCHVTIPILKLLIYGSVFCIVYVINLFIFDKNSFYSILKLLNRKAG